MSCYSLLIDAMRHFGCAVGGANAWRHMVCEECSPDVEGGFDVTTNQVVICSNHCKTDDKVAEILKHELVHMYDHCTADVNFDNVSHLACTEVRAANLSQCRFDVWNSRLSGSAHRDCVKDKAARSVAIIKNVSAEEAVRAVDAVFVRCYADLEPVGRRTAGEGCERLAGEELGGFLRATLSERNARRRKQTDNKARDG